MLQYKVKRLSSWEQNQKTTLTIIYEVKQDLRRKARLVAGGHLVDPSDHSIYSSTIKGISVKLLHVISHKADLGQLCGDVSLAFVNAFTMNLFMRLQALNLESTKAKLSLFVKLCLDCLQVLTDGTHALTFCQYSLEPECWRNL
jgi:hypothetical protein